MGGDSLQEAERLLREGNRKDAYPLLTEYLRAHPRSARGWWMLSLAVGDLTQQIDCMEHVLQIDSDYEPARYRLAKLQSKLATESSNRDSSQFSASRPAPTSRLIGSTSQPRDAVSPASGKKTWSVLQIVILSGMACIAVGIFGFLGVMLVQGSVLSAARIPETQTVPQSTPEFAMPISLPPTWTPTASVTPTASLTPTITLTPVPPTSTLRYTLTPTEIPSSSIGPYAGYYAPDFALRHIDTDAKVSLSQYQGKAVLLYFWTTWCPYCEAESFTIQQIHEGYQDNGLIVLGIDVGEAAGKARRYRDSHGLSFPILNDSSQAVAEKYHVDGFPTHFFIDATGKITYVGIGLLDYSTLNNKVRAIVNSIP